MDNVADLLPLKKARLFPLIYGELRRIAGRYLGVSDRITRCSPPRW